MRTGWLAVGVLGLCGGTVAPALLLPWLDQAAWGGPATVGAVAVAWLAATVATAAVGFTKAGY